MMIHTRTQTNGFSLVELLIAFFVLLVGVLAVLVLFPLGLQESKTMVEASTAAFAARSARTLMQVHPFVYSGNRQGNGSASMVQSIYGPRGSMGNVYIGTFPAVQAAGCSQPEQSRPGGGPLEPTVLLGCPIHRAPRSESESSPGLLPGVREILDRTVL